MDKIRERMSRRLRTAAANPGEASEDGLGLGEDDITNLAAVAAVPAEPRPLEPGRLRLKQEEEELEGRQLSDVLQVSSLG
jgi:hypothetical protein